MNDNAERFADMCPTSNHVIRECFPTYKDTKSNFGACRPYDGEPDRPRVYREEVS
ncbi:hypothetical protein DPMN_054876 [Dreissena polymorpha]|uniref:Uncharacterized protein n=1 Tax=Dreissena polymorpha TaxID=45954 RepID=A0A9D4CNX2_DREPO|nr:hypothetical protein DPMN_054876 [Dreissena polymorpha]